MVDVTVDVSRLGKERKGKDFIYTHSSITSWLTIYYSDGWRPPQKHIVNLGEVNRLGYYGIM